MGKKYTTNFLEDTNGSTGASNQVLISTPSGIDWVDGSAIPGVPAGSGAAGQVTVWSGTDVITGYTRFKVYDAGGQIQITDGTRDIRINSGYSGSIAMIGTSSSHDLGFMTGNSQRVTINTSGNVGIGTTSPTQKLHVDGNLRVTGAYYDSNNTPGTLGQILSSTATGTDWIDQDTIISAASKLVVIACKNTSGATITKGTPVYQTGTVGATDVIEIAEADSSDEDKMAAIGLLQTDIANNAFGNIVITGELLNFTTSPIDGVTPTTGDTIYVKPGGGLTLTKPTGVNFIQNVGLVGKVSGGNAGSITVSSIMRSNDVPTPLYVDHDNQRLGIGTTSPDSILHVKTPNGITATLEIQGGVNPVTAAGQVNAQLDFGSNDGSVGNNNPGGRIASLTENTNGALVGMAFSTFQQSRTVELEEAMRITNAGNVGIGTTNPSQKLQIGEISAGGSGTNPDAITLGRTFSSVAGQNLKIRVYDDGTNKAGFGVSSNKLDYSVWSTGADHVFYANTSELMRIKGTGNVGIGTTSPGYKLTVNGDVDVNNGAILAAQAYGINLGVSGYDIVMPTTTRIAIKTSSSERVSILNNGNVGIGTTNPAQNFVISNSTNGQGVEIIPGTTGTLQAYNRGASVYVPLNIDTLEARVRSIGATVFNNGSGFSESMRINSAGNVGIGTTSPGTRLHVVGSNMIFKVENASTTTNDYSQMLLQAGTATNYIWTQNQNSTNYGGAYSLNIYTQQAGPIAFFTNGNNERMRIDSSGAVLIGGQPKIDTATKLQVGGNDSGVTSIWSNADDIVFEHNTNLGLTFATPNDAAATIAFADPQSVQAGWIQYLHDVDAMRFGTNGNNERMRIDSNGNFGFRVVAENSSGVWRNFQIGGGANLVTRGSNANDLLLGTGFYFNTANQELYKNTEAVSRMFFNNDVMQFQNAASGTAGTAITWNERMRIDSSGNVGIGTTSPDRQLEVYGTNDGYMKFDGGRVGNHGYTIGSDNSGFIIYDDTLGSYRFVIDQDSGNVGIGVTDPEKRLEVKSDTTYDGIMIDVLSAPEITFRDRGNSDTRVGTGRHALDGFHIDTYSGNAFFIKGSNRFVGIGTTSPDNILHIRKGDTTYASQVGADTMLFLETTNVSNALQFTSANTGQQYIMFGDDDPNVGWISYNHSDNNLNFRVNALERMRIDSSGDVLINATAKYNTYPGGFITQSLASSAGDFCPILELVGNRNANAGNQNAMIQFFNKTSTAVEVGRITSSQGSATNSGQLQFHTANAGTLTEKMRIDSSGNVGIGTDSPSSFNQRVDAPHLVVGSGSNSAGLTIYSGTVSQGSINFADGLTTTDQYTGGIVYVHGSDNYMTFYTNGGTERMRIDSSGKAGIGTTTLNAISGANPTLTLGGTGISGGLILQRAGTDKARLYENAGNMVHQGMTGVGHHFYVNAATQAMVIDSSGNVGIGNTNPSDYSADANNLVVGSLSGNNGITILSTSSSGYGSLYFADSTTGNKVYSGYIRYQQNQSNMTFGTNEAERMRIDLNGNVGIGTTSPTTKLYVDGGESTLNRGNSAGTIATFRGQNAAKAVIGTATSYFTSNVGIGVTSPSAKLEVTYNGSNGSAGYTDYGILTTTGGGGQATIGAMHDGDGYANINLGSNVSSSNVFWHISKRVSNSNDLGGNNGLDYFYYNGSGFTNVFGFSTTGYFKAADGATFAGAVGIGGTTPSSGYMIDITPTAGNIIRSTRGTSVFGAYQSNNSDVYLGTISNNTFKIITNDGTAITIGADKNATFAGDITLGDDLNFTTNGFADISNTGTGAMRFKPSSQTLALTLTGANATFAGDISTSTVQISNGTSYNENIRMFPSTSNDYSSLILGAVSGTSGTGYGQWTLVRYPYATHSHKFSIRHSSSDIMVMTTGGDTTFAGSINTSGSINLTNAGLNTIAASNPSNGYLRFLVDQQGVALTLNADTTSTFGGVIYAVDGNKGAPGISFANDTDTGIFRDSSSAIGFSTGGNARMLIESNGEVGINTTNPSATLHLTAIASNGVPFKLEAHPSTSVSQMLIYATKAYNSTDAWYNLVCEAGDGSGGQTNTLIIERDGDVRNKNNSYGQISDIRLKENITDATPKLEDIKKLKVKNFNLIGDDLKQIGLIAQEVEEVFPGLVKEDKQPDINGEEGGVYKSVKYSVLVPMLIKAMQEQQEQIDELKKQINN